MPVERAVLAADSRASIGWSAVACTASVQLRLESVVTLSELETIRGLLASAPFYDGRLTSHLEGKNNLQLELDNDSAREAATIIRRGLEAHPLFKLGVFARTYQIVFSKYEVGMEYPEHVDAALFAGIRADVAITVFLSHHDSYDGGELVVHTGNGDRRYREPAGTAIVYPASTLHSVSRVARGTRLAAVIWVQSTIRDAEQRAILLELGGALGKLEEKVSGKASLERLRRAYWNLVRMWAEV